MKAALIVVAALSAPPDTLVEDIQKQITEQCETGCYLIKSTDGRNVERVVRELQQQVLRLQDQVDEQRGRESRRMLCT